VPSSPNYKRDYSKSGEGKYDSSAKRKKDRAARNKARREMIAKGKVKKGDGLDVNHVKPLSKGGSRKTSNTNVQTAHKNRSYKRNKDGSMK
jgi:5-methylcytosine-specific restriction endonuclease McrA